MAKAALNLETAGAMLGRASAFADTHRVVAALGPLDFDVRLITLDETALPSDRVAVMSARAGRLIDIVANPAFGALTSRLWALRREESKKALGV